MPDFDQKEQSSAAMEKLNIAMKQLRDCISMQACEKSFINAAVALLDLVSLGACHNPFVCLHQAAIFSSHGTQGGNSDLPFKRLLPSIEDISALEALVILGRADCMRALSFIDQSMFLCTFILRICSLRRSCTNPDFMWNPKWKIVGIHAYMVCSTIDDLMATLPGCDVRKAKTKWDKDELKELKCCRKDAISLNRSYAKKGNFPVSHTEEDSASEYEDETEDDEAEADETFQVDMLPMGMTTHIEEHIPESNVELNVFDEPLEVFAI